MNTVEAIAVLATALVVAMAMWATAVITQQALIP